LSGKSLELRICNNYNFQTLNAYSSSDLSGAEKHKAGVQKKVSPRIINKFTNYTIFKTLKNKINTGF